MVDVTNLADYRPPVAYVIRVLHHWDGTLDIVTEGISTDQRSRSSLAVTLRAFANQLDDQTLEAVPIEDS